MEMTTTAPTPVPPIFSKEAMREVMAGVMIRAKKSRFLLMVRRLINSGYSVAVSGDTTVIGSYLDDDNGTSSGSAYIFQRDQGGAGNWGASKKVTSR